MYASTLCCTYMWQRLSFFFPLGYPTYVCGTAGTAAPLEQCCCNRSYSSTCLYSNRTAAAAVVVVCACGMLYKYHMRLWQTEYVSALYCCCSTRSCCIADQVGRSSATQQDPAVLLTSRQKFSYTPGPASGFHCCCCSCSAASVIPAAVVFLFYIYTCRDLCPIISRKRLPYVWTSNANTLIVILICWYYTYSSTSIVHGCSKFDWESESRQQQ